MTAKRFPLLVLAVALLAGLLYLPTLHYPLVWDDSDIITNNTLIRSTTPFAYFGKSFWAGGPTTSLGQDPYYRPLTNFTLWLDYHVGNGKPVVFHLHNLLMFSLLTALLILLLARLLHSRRAALFGGLLFAVHPLHSEVVSYVSGRTDLLMALWIVVSAYAFARLTAQAASHRPHKRQATGNSPRSASRLTEVAKSPGQPLVSRNETGAVPDFAQFAVRSPQSAVLWSALALIAFALACFAKETALLFPIVALGWLLLTRTRTRLMTVTVVGLFAVAVLYVASRTSVLHTLAVFRAPESLARLLLLSLNSFGLNCGLLLIPFVPRLFYESSLLNNPSLLTLLGVLALGLPLILWRRLDSIARVGYFWLLLFLLPFASLVSLGPVGRLSLLPGIGVLLLALPPSSREHSRRLAPGLVVGLLVYCLALGTALVHRNRNWESESLLFTKMTIEAPSNVAGHFNLATVYDHAGNRDLAANEYRAALRIRPDLAVAHNNLGTIEQAANQPESALVHFQEAVRLQPDYPQAHNNLAILLRAGSDTPGAIREFRKAIELRPDDAGALYNLARIYFAGHDFALAAPLLDNAARLHPDDPRIRALQSQVRDSLTH
jgi:tetratricopeptide (TPR) repeat protein